MLLLVILIWNWDTHSRRKGEEGNASDVLIAHGGFDSNYMLIRLKLKLILITCDFFASNIEDKFVVGIIKPYGFQEGCSLFIVHISVGDFDTLDLDIIRDSESLINLESASERYR